MQQKVVLITGAAGGMGAALARRFAASGARLGLLDVHQEQLRELETSLREAGAEVVAVPCDVTDTGAVAAAVQTILDALGRLDVLINNAGITHRSAFAATQISVFRKVMEVNFFGALHCTKAALPYLLQSRGAIVVISSIAGFSPLFGRSGYAASKYALHGLFESLRCELREQGVHVLMVCPGFTATGIEKNALGADGKPAGTPRSTTGRIARPEEVAEAVFRGVVKKKERIVLSSVGKLAYWISRLAPSLYERAMTQKLRHELA